jgi:ubiquinone/menaquinone biosynthesis C-methylase UbiE
MSIWWTLLLISAETIDIRMNNYNSITEVPGLMASSEQIARIYHRYRFAREYANSRDILEVACGSGMGLGYLSAGAKSVVGGDIDHKNVDLALTAYKNSPIRVKEMDAHHLPFEDKSFDLVLLFEALYYLQKPEIFIKEAARIIRDNGILMVCTVNKDWIDFHPSPFTHFYFSAPELNSLLKPSFQEIAMFGAFPVQMKGIKTSLISRIKRIAVCFNLIPNSLTARAYMKRIFMGPLKPIPPQVTDCMAPYEPPVPISFSAPTSEFKIVYALAIKGEHAEEML